MKTVATFLLLFLMSLPAFAMEHVPQSEYRERRVKLAERLHGGAAVLFAATEPLLDFMPYRQDSDFYYLTGWTEPAAAVLIVGAGPATVLPRIGSEVPAHTYREILFLPERNLVLEKYTGEKLDTVSQDARSKTGFDEVLPVSELPRVLAHFAGEDRRRVANLWWQTDVDSGNAAMRFLTASLGDTAAVPLHDVRTLTMPLRSVKSAAEIDLLKKAADASTMAQLAGMKAIKPGVTERTIAGVEIAEFMKQGCERPSYAPIVGAGANAVVLHYSENSATIAEGDLILIDEACEYSMYASDITRTMPATGKFTARQREIYEIVLGAQRAAAAAFIAGKTRLGNVNERGDDVHDTLDKVAYDYVNAHGTDLHGAPLGKYFLHGVGHHVGIDVHDPYDPSQPLNRGNVFTLEPGIYIPEEKIGVRIEDVLYVDANGQLVDLVKTLPRDANAIEAAMR
jgi:Xaa-Pro aminopeptidase